MHLHASDQNNDIDNKNRVDNVMIIALLLFLDRIPNSFFSLIISDGDRMLSNGPFSMEN